MNTLDQLKRMPNEYQFQYCWARAVEWRMLPAFVAQPILPILYLFLPWQSVLLWVFAANFIWYLAFCTAAISLPVAAAAMVWTKMKWFSLVGVGGYLLCTHQWVISLLTLFTPIVAAVIGQITVRRQIDLIQEFFMLQLGHVKTDASPEVQRYITRVQGSSDSLPGTGHRHLILGSRSATIY